ncbi:MAG: 3-hydroxyacyl-CoA dehydrogenase NAD-binding domain-containing protein, partial [Solirubrobacterales bacterium]
MVILDTALDKREREGNPIRVGLVGAGYMGRGIALQFLTPLTGMRLVAIANRTLSQAKRAYFDAGVETVETIDTVSRLEKAIKDGRYAITENPDLICEAGNIDAIIEA